jgi:GntR family transcriptional regulator/MocR family aminotransferase
MGIYLASQLLFSKNDAVIVGDRNYIAANLTIQDAGTDLLRVDVDENGINTEQIAALCEKQSIRAVYITPHHHHPTTVTLSAKRRMHLLALSYQYKFAIIEDDYDYDFHYTHSPILPLASSDSQGSVVYIGALSKIVVPGIRIGYMIAPKSFIDEAAHLRRIIDRQGDSMMELTYAQMIKDGDIQRHSKKALKIYRERRDHFCDILSADLGNHLDFKVPDGGMAVWTTLKGRSDWKTIRTKALSKGLSIESNEKYNTLAKDYSGIRMGFASLDKQEIEKALGILTQVINRL